MGRRAVEVVIALLDVLAMISLVAGKTEEPLLQDRIAPIPHRDREADVLVTVADAGNAVLVPAVCARPCVIVRQIFPSVTVRSVVLAHRAPGALAEVGPPTLPVRPLVTSLFEPQLFLCHVRDISCTVHTRDACQLVIY